MKRLLLILLFVVLSACQAQDVMPYPDTFINYIVNQDNSPSIMLRTSSDRECFVSGCQSHLLLIHKESQRIVLEHDSTGLVWMQVSEDGQRLGLFYMLGRAGRSADDVRTLIEIRSMEDGRVLFSTEYESTGLESDFDSFVRPHFVFSADLNIVIRHTSIDYLREVSVWDIRTNELLYSRECEYGMFTINSEILSPDGKYLLFGCSDEEEPPQEGISGTMELIELETGEVLQEIDRYHRAGEVEWDNTSSYFMTTGNGRVRLYGLESELTEIETSDYYSPRSDFSPDSRFYLSIGLENLDIVNLADGNSTRISTTSFRSTQLGNIAVAPNSSRILLAGEANRFAVVNMVSGEIEAQNSISSNEFGYNRFGDTWHPEEHYAAFCGETHSVFLWESATEDILTLPSLNLPQGSTHCQLSFSSDGRYLAYERYLRAMDNRENSVSIEVFELETMSSVFQKTYVLGDALLTMLEWQTGRNRLFVTNPAESEIEVHEFP